jgi:hypothetical protein
MADHALHELHVGGRIGSRGGGRRGWRVLVPALRRKGRNGSEEQAGEDDPGNAHGDDLARTETVASAPDNPAPR